MTDVSLRIKVDSSETDKGKKSLDDLAKAGANAEGSSKGLTEQTNRLSTAAKAAQAAFTALVGSMAIRKVVEYADEWQNAENRLKLVTASSADLARVQGVLLGVANSTRASFSSTAELYTTLTRSTTALGLTSAELVAITKTINQTFQVAGSSAAGMEGAIRQLSQGLASGALRGDEFNSVAEQAPGIMDALAASLKMTRGELRDFAATGGITSEILVKALQQYASTAEGMAATATRTFGQSMTEARNNMLAFVGSSDSVKSATSVAGSAVVTMSKNLDVAAEAAVLLAGVMTARMIPAVAASTAAYIASTAQSLAYQAALARMAGVSATAAASQTALSGALALVGGPAGALLIAAGSLIYFVSKMESASESTARLLNSLEELNREELGRGIEAQKAYNEGLETRIERLGRQNMSVAANRDRMAELRAELEEGQKALQKLETGMRGIDEREFGEMLDEYFPPLQQFTESTQAAAEATNLQASASKALIEMMDNAADASYNTASAYRQLMASQGAVIPVMDQVTTRTSRLTEEQKNANLTNKDAQDSIDGIVDGLGRQKTVSKELTQVTNLMRDDISSAFADMMMNGENAFDAIAKSFERMVYKMVADLMASEIFNLIGKLTNIGSLQIGGSANAGSILGSIIRGGSSAAAGTTVAAAAGTAAAGTTGAAAAGTAAAGGGIISGITGAVSSAGSAISGAVAAIPGWGWALAGGAAIAALLSDKSTPSSNAGILLSDLPGVAADRKRDVAPFASGVDPVLFARRDDFGRAEQIAESLRSADKVIMDRFAAAGKTFQITGPELAAFSETGMGSGQFLGIAAEDGKVALTAEQSVKQYMQELIKAGARYTGTNVQPSGSPDQMLEQLDLALLHGSHANGLNYVPFDGYRAELHRGERVMTANESRQMDAGWGKMASELSNMRAMLSETARATARTADLLLRVTRDGESLVTVAA